MEITVIDERIESGAWWSMPRYAGYLAAAVRVGEVYMQDVRQPLLLAFARVFGVRIYAGTGDQNPILRINSGSYVVCDAPKGCTTTGRP